MDALLIYRDGKYVRRHVLEGKEVLIGRAGTLVLDSPEVSRRHASLTRSPQGYYVKDLGSSDGTRLNGEAIPPNLEKLIFSGDQVGVGLFTIRCVFAASEEALRAAETAPLPPPLAIEGLDRTSVGGPSPFKRPKEPDTTAPPPSPPRAQATSPVDPTPAPRPAPAPVRAPPPASAAPPWAQPQSPPAPAPAPPPAPAPAPPRAAVPSLQPPPTPSPAPAVAPLAPSPIPAKLHTGTAQIPVRPELASALPPASAPAPPPASLGPFAPTTRRAPDAPPARPGAPVSPASPGAVGGAGSESGSIPPGPRLSTGTAQMRARPELLLDAAFGGPPLAPPPPPPGAPKSAGISGPLGALLAAAPSPVPSPAPAPVALSPLSPPTPKLHAPSLGFGRSPADIEAAIARGSTVPVPAVRKHAPATGAQQLYLDDLDIGSDRREARSLLPEGAETLGVEQWLQFDIFADVAKDRVRKHLERYEDQHPIWVRRYKKGESIVREGEYGSTAFYILHGTCEVYIAARMGAATGALAAPSGRGGAKGGGLLGRIASVFSAGGGKRAPLDERPRTIPIDGPVDLDMLKPVATLGEGDVFGEMTCMNFYPRSATVRASEDMVCFEMLRSVLVDLLQRNSKTFKQKLEEAYRTRALNQHLRGVPMFADLPQAFIDHLKTRVELVGPLEPGEVICKEGDAADSFYLVRLGFVKVAQQHPGGELVLAYLGRGQYFGEIGLLESKPRMATCSALDRVELVKIKKEDFDLLVAQNPAIKTKLLAGSAERKDAVRALAERTVSTTVHLDDFIAQGLINAQNVLLIDLEKCTRCDECVRACGESHGGVSRLIRDGLRFDKYLVTSSCRACTDPVCMVGCPVGSIRRRGSLEIVIEDWCIGCGKCSNQCPYGNINMVDFPAFEETPTGKKIPLLDNDGEQKIKTQATTCDLSYGREEPACVYACPHEAAMRVEPRSFFGL